MYKKVFYVGKSISFVSVNSASWETFGLLVRTMFATTDKQEFTVVNVNNVS